MVVGTAWPINLSLAELDAPVDAVDPVRGGDRLGRHVDDLGERTAPQLHAQWMEWTLQPDVQAEVAVCYGAAGSNIASCDATLICSSTLYGEGADAAVDTVRYGYCGDAEFLNSLYLWKTPQVDCGDDRGDVCIDYSEWTQAWTEIRGA